MPPVDRADLAFALVGIGALLAGLLPRLLERRALSMPVVFLGLGMVVFALPVGLPTPDPLQHPELAEHLTELVVIVALMGAGPRLDRPVGWRRWSSTWRLLAIAMPLTIAATAVLGWWWIGLAPATAMLLGSALAPTDPVLASDVQVGEPTEDEESEDEVRFALTSEAGLNDALAFPFLYAAIAMAAYGADPAGWFGRWFAVDVVYRLAAGVACGLLVGWLLGWLFFRPRSRALRLARHGEGFTALAATFLAYGVTELVQGYGFLAVFVCACSIRAAERLHEYHQVLHEFVEQIERLLTVLLLLLLGGAVVGGLLTPLTWQAVAVGLAVLLLIRPAVAGLSLWRAPGTAGEKAVVAVFGIRGIGSLYYLSYALATTAFPEADQAWATAGFVVVVSVVAHGVAATPVMDRLDRNRARSTTPTPG
ncbi:MAG TPA: cation:proton antiporter [Cryptosporangiaceae bacterium]|nr:cation:proton antiporter [Cryptosporangiaceae bacterium]